MVLSIEFKGPVFRAFFFIEKNLSRHLVKILLFDIFMSGPRLPNEARAICEDRKQNDDDCEAGSSPG